MRLFIYDYTREYEPGAILTIFANNITAMLKFKTNIRCDGCIKTVTPYLSQVSGIRSWKVDLDSADRILTIEGDTAEAAAVIDALGNAGYRAEQI